MFLVLLLVTLVVAALTSTIIAFFRNPTLAIFTRIIGEQ